MHVCACARESPCYSITLLHAASTSATQNPCEAFALCTPALIAHHSAHWHSNDPFQAAICRASSGSGSDDIPQPAHQRLLGAAPARGAGGAVVVRAKGVGGQRGDDSERQNILLAQVMCVEVEPCY